MEKNHLIISFVVIGVWCQSSETLGAKKIQDLLKLSCEVETYKTLSLRQAFAYIHRDDSQNLCFGTIDDWARFDDLLY